LKPLGRNPPWFARGVSPQKGNFGRVANFYLKNTGGDLMELTPEEREKIYQEEKARLEAQSQIKAEIKAEKSAKNKNALAAVGILAVFVLGIFLFINYNTLKPVPEPEHSEKKAYIASQTFVNTRLKAPGTAKFPDYESFDSSRGLIVTFTKKGGFIDRDHYSVMAYVDAQNSYGGLLRKKYLCDLAYVGNGKWECINLIMFD
jgi:hypothetical protein